MILLVGFLFIKLDKNEHQAAAVVSRPAFNAATALQLRDEAAADLRKKLQRLPDTASPPLNTLYYDVRVDMKKTLSANIPWTATIHGWENAIDPATSETLSRTEFTLKTDYENGEWYFKHFQASVHSIREGKTVDLEENENTATPPSLMGELGLKRRAGAPVRPPPLLPEETTQMPAFDHPALPQPSSGVPKS